MKNAIEPGKPVETYQQRRLMEDYRNTVPQHEQAIWDLLTRIVQEPDITCRQQMAAAIYVLAR